MNASSSPPPSSPDTTDDEPPLSSREKHVLLSTPHLRIDQSPSLRPISNSRASSPTTTSPSPPTSPSTTTTTTRTSAQQQKHATLPRAYRITRYSRYFIIISILLSFISIFVMLDSFQHHQRDVDGCQDSFMQPIYIRQSGFDSEMTRFASKYALYLYREKDVDLSDQPTGVPVLFIPGHAGSHKQIRSISAETAYAYYQHYATHPEILKQGIRNLDFFTVDFHEEFSALHGQSLLEQAEYLNDAIDYILKLYPRSRKSRRYPDPTSVIILGHSMGGVVARSMFLLNNYQPGSINTIITLSTPHILPPAPFDWKISKIYDDMHRFWVNGYTHGNGVSSSSSLSNDAVATTDLYWATSLKDVMLISIAGGTLDNIVCSDSANVGAFLPTSNGFTVFTTAIPNVWTGTDHLSIYSCKQLVRVLAKSMLDIVDTRRPAQTKPLQDRMAVMKKAFLSGLDDRTQDLSLGRPNHSEIPDRDIRQFNMGERLVIQSNDHPVRLSLLPRTLEATGFSVLTDQSIGQGGSRFSLVFCNRMSRVASDTTRLVCQSADKSAIPVPASTQHDNYPFSGRTFSFASFRMDEMQEYEWFGVIDHYADLGKGAGQQQQQQQGGGFLVAESYHYEDNVQRIEKSMFSIAMEGVYVVIDPPALFTSVLIPAIENPMLAYHLKVSRHGCSDMFAPFLRQSISSMHESKFYVNLANNEDETDVSLHGRTAFSSMTMSTRDIDHQGLSLQVWMDPTCQEPLQIDLSVDWYGSAGRIGFRNGIMLLTYAFITVMLVLAGQIYCYNKTGIFPHFGQGLSFCIRRTLPVIIPIVALCSIYQCTTQPLHHLPAYTVLDDLDVSIAWHDLLIGNSDPFFWWLPLVGLLMSLGTISFVWLVVELLLHFCASISSFLIGHRFYPTTWYWCNRSNETRSQKFQRRAITTMILFVLVATCIPYQFVFVVAFLVHIISCIRSLTRTWAAPLQGYKRANRYHYMQSLLILMMTLLPFNLPILVVWIRNLSVHWFVPFSSDHNVFAIAPFILYVELLTGSRKMLPRTKGPWHWGTCVLIYSIVAYTFLYGIKYTHSIYFLSNHMIAWFLFLHVRDSHYGRMTYRYVADHLYPFRSKKHS
ncbi:PGAP1-like protein-domain-containing protein [Phascolomyces articulosus]|uniref:GPI inositol-deacylase n=1 Tax=Phascolomyces articulosus TaxID=60185 RepID=A0AAD5JWK3_9FUNG|nr:PGAP1-like protein-domain-containing protein [Phascolomyces articulosus]